MSNYYQTIQQLGKLRTEDHARRWSTAVLKTLALNIDRGTKKNLAQELRHKQADQQADDLMRIFWLLHFRNKGQSTKAFMNQVARRAGNSDWQFAEIPTRAVFHGLKELVSQDMSKQIADSLAPDVSEVWQNA